MRSGRRRRSGAGAGRLQLRRGTQRRFRGGGRRVDGASQHRERVVELLRPRWAEDDRSHVSRSDAPRLSGHNAVSQNQRGVRFKMQSEGFRRSLTQGQPMVLAGSRPHDWAGRGRSRAEARTAAHRDLRVAVMVVSLEMGLSRRSGATQRADSPLGCWRLRQRGEQEARTRSTAGRTKPRAASGWTAFERRNTTMRQTQTDTRPMGTETRRADPGDPGGRWTSREQTGALGRGRITSRRPRRWREGEPRLQGQRRGGGRGWRRAGRYRCTQEATCRSR